MNDYQKIINAKKGEMVSIVRNFDNFPDPVSYFSRLTDYGRRENSLLLESADIVSKYGERSIGAINPCLKVAGQGKKFQVTALNPTGIFFLDELYDDLAFCEQLKHTDRSIIGVLKPEKNIPNEEERLKSRNHFELLRTINNKFTPQTDQFSQYGGLFGAISYDMIDQFEDLPAAQKDIIQDPDYEMYYVDNLFVMDHTKGKMLILANALITDQYRD